ncbi:MAG: hypothetical protein PHV28_02915 [Kiritimatiellae bacterium]|nr:hypothetical protein [Kiritimatiellia bacterium]
MKKPDNSIVLYQDENGITNVKVLFAGEDLWLAQNQSAEIYDTTKQNIGQHAKNILTDGELSENSVVKEFFTTAADGKSYNTKHYNLDMIIAVRRDVLKGTGSISRQQAIEKAEKEFAIYRAREMRQLESDFDRAVKQLAKLNPPLRKEDAPDAED